MSDPWEDAMGEPVVIKKPNITFMTTPVVSITTTATATIQPSKAVTADAKPTVGYALAQSMATLNRQIAHTTLMESGGVRDKRAEADAIRWSELAYEAKRVAKQAKMDAFNGVRRR